MRQAQVLVYELDGKLDGLEGVAVGLIAAGA